MQVETQKEIQNVNILVVVGIILAACVLHNMCMEEVCEDHPNGCPLEENDDE